MQKRTPNLHRNRQNCRPGRQRLAEETKIREEEEKKQRDEEEKRAKEEAE